jgi:hypothetical protein
LKEKWADLIALLRQLKTMNESNQPVARIPTGWPPLNEAGEPMKPEERLRELQSRLRYVPELSRDDRDALIDLIEVWRGWRFMLKSTRLFLIALATLAAAATAWDTIGVALRHWLKGG